MGKIYWNYKCAECGFERSTDVKQYDSDDKSDPYRHSYMPDQQMRDSQYKAIHDPCPKCGSKGFQYSGKSFTSR
jgi:ribosomal protein L37E